MQDRAQSWQSVGEEAPRPGRDTAEQPPPKPALTSIIPVQASLGEGGKKRLQGSRAAVGPLGCQRHSGPGAYADTPPLPWDRRAAPQKHRWSDPTSGSLSCHRLRGPPAPWLGLAHHLLIWYFFRMASLASQLRTPAAHGLLVPPSILPVCPLDPGGRNWVSGSSLGAHGLTRSRTSGNGCGGNE